MAEPDKRLFHARLQPPQEMSANGKRERETNIWPHLHIKGSMALPSKSWKGEDLRLHLHQLQIVILAKTTVDTTGRVCQVKQEADCLFCS